MKKKESACAYDGASLKTKEGRCQLCGMTRDEAEKATVAWNANYHCARGQAKRCRHCAALSSRIRQII